MYEIKDRQGILLAIVGNITDVPSGQNFCEDANSPLQWGTAKLDKGVILQSHLHKMRERIKKHRTIEFFYIAEGKLQVDFYSEDKQKVDTRVLDSGDFMCQYNGGHGFKTLRPNTVFIEIKNGPFVGAEEDKEKF